MFRKISSSILFQTILIAFAIISMFPRIASGGQPLLLQSVALIVVDDSGDATEETRLTFPTNTAYQEVKNRFPNPHAMMRHMTAGITRAVLRDVTVSYDDSTRSILMRAVRVGAAASRGGKWRIHVGGTADMVHKEDGLAVFYQNVIIPPGMIISGVSKVTLPAGAGEAEYDKRSGLLSYAVQRSPVIGNYGNLRAELTARENIMSATYKVYGDGRLFDGAQWVGRAQLINDGDCDLTDVRVSYRLGEFSDWSPESRYDLVPPGGTLVDYYHPIFKASAMELLNPTPVYLEMKYSYRDGNGERREEQTSERTRVLGRSSFLYSPLPDREAISWSDRFLNAPLLASLVTRMDPIVREFAGLAAQASGGAAVYQNDEQAIAFCKAVYDQMALNGISYLSSIAFLTESANLVQELKYPRDVLRDKSGTCIELAICYAAVCEAGGLKTGLVLLPGHCFSVIELPSGRLLPVENTTLLGSAVGKYGSFEQSTEIAQREMNELQPEKFYIVDVQTLQEQGVVPPELPTIPVDSLKNWDIKLHLPKDDAQSKNGGGQGTTPPEPQPPRPQPPTPQPRPTPPPQPQPQPSEGNPVTGKWEGRYGPQGHEYRMLVDIGPRFAGTVAYEDEGFTAKIISALYTRGAVRELSIAIIWESKDPRGNDVPVWAVLKGPLSDTKWSGKYNVFLDRGGPPGATGNFSTDFLEPPKEGSDVDKWRKADNGGSEGQLAGAWRGTYINSWGVAQGMSARMDLVDGGKYRGEIRIDGESAVFESVYGNDGAGVAVVVATWRESTLSLVGRVEDGEWAGEIHYSDPNAGDTGTFVLEKE